MNEMLPSLDELLERITAVGGSDLHLKVGSPPAFRIDGVVHRSDLPSVTQADTARYLDEIIPDQAREAFERTGEAGFAIGRSGLGRFRVSAFSQRGSVTLVVRTVGTVTGGFEALGEAPLAGFLALPGAGPAGAHEVIPFLPLVLTG